MGGVDPSDLFSQLFGGGGGMVSSVVLFSCHRTLFSPAIH